MLDEEDRVTDEPCLRHREPSFGYAREKLGVAVYKLATGIEGIKARLAAVYIELVILQAEDFPAHLVSEWRAIKTELTKGKMKYHTVVQNGELVEEHLGKLYSTVPYLRLEKAQRIAERIYNLEHELRRYCDRDDDGWE